MNANYEVISNTIDTHVDDYMGMVKAMYDHPELGFVEYESQKLLVEYLKNAGFEVETGLAVATDFVATYKSAKEGPTIGFMCEYDALPEVGHGCGHNLIAGIGIAAG
ncbi:MAG: M20 family peptidase, partial [Erysipelotrichales bacterium]|nr:M20 family peptidase [Erysipelotrichales bacterium]